MLTRLHIRNLAVVDAAELEFHSGLTALTGETGAGKSIMVDALALALGERADSRSIRAGADRCEVTAGFQVAEASSLDAWLRDHDLEHDGECLIRRIVTAEGRSRGYLNGQPVPMQTLQAIGEKVVDICGQQAHQRLRHRAVQRELLDRFGGHAGLCEELAAAHAAWRDACEERDRLIASAEDLDARRELLGFQLRELEGLNLAAGEFTELEQEERRLANAGRIGGGLQEILDNLYEADQGAAQSLIARGRSTLQGLAELDDALAPITELLGEAEVLLVEAADGLRQGLERNEHDPAREQAVADRVAAARGLARKHRCEPEALPAVAERLADELESLDDRDHRLAGCEQTVAERESALARIAKRLSAARAGAAKALSEAVSDNMRALGMPDGRFAVTLAPNADNEIGANGAETVVFEVAVNAGQPPGPLARVASGGELSRISLALQVVATGNQPGDTLIFDEVDAGVGGGVAEIVGQQLQALSRDYQVLCVTHLPQVASQADHHLKVTKISDGKATRTAVKPLTEDERVEEIARMLGGVEITGRTRDHAREMLDLAAARRTG